MTSSSSFQFLSVGKNGTHRIDWFSHAWSEVLAELPEGVLLALEPRMENTNSRNAVLSASQQAAFDAWNSGFPSQQANPVSLRAVRPVGNFHRMEALSNGPETLQVDTFVTLSDGHWTSSGVRQKRGQHQVEFDIERGQHGLRIAVSLVRSSSHKPSLSHLVEVVDRGQGPTLRPLLVTPAIATMLSKKFGIDAQVNDDALSPQQWNGGAAAVLQRLGSSFDPALGPAERLTLAYWRAAGNLLGFGELLADTATRTQKAALRSVSSFPATFAPHEALESMAIAAARELGWLSATNLPMAATRWNEVCARATEFRSAFEQGAVAAFPDPLPERCTDQATLERALLRVTAVRHLAGFSGSAQWGGGGEAIASIAESLMGSSAELASFLQTVRVERVLKAEAESLAQTLMFEFGPGILAAGSNVAANSVQAQIDILRAQLQPVLELRASLSRLSETVGADERTIAAANRVIHLRASQLDSELRAATKLARERFVLGETYAGSPPSLVGGSVGIAAGSDPNPYSTASLQAAVDRLHEVNRQIARLDAWSTLQQTALISALSSKLDSSGFQPSRRDPILAAANSAIVSLDGPLLDHIDRVAPRQGRTLQRVVEEVVSQREIFRIVCSAPPETSEEGPEVTRLVRQIRHLLSGLDVELGPSTDWSALDTALDNGLALFAAHTWFVSNDGSLGGNKRRLASAWRQRVSYAKQELSRQGIPFSDVLLDLAWSVPTGSGDSAHATVRSTLKRHGCLPDASFAYAVTKSWPS